MNRLMRILVMFDLPVKTKAERRSATQFRNFLVGDGYHMVQYSVYARVCNGRDSVETHKKRILLALPSKVPSTFMRKFICRLRLNEVSRQ